MKKKGTDDKKLAKMREDKELAKMREESMERVKQDIREGRVDDAIRFLANSIVYAAVVPKGIDKAELHYLMGNAYRKKGDFSEALNQYRAAMDIDPKSPAVEARKAIQGILSFYYKDKYNH